MVLWNIQWLFLLQLLIRLHHSLCSICRTAIGEFFRDTGRDALIIYDDLSKQLCLTGKSLFCFVVRRDVRHIRRCFLSALQASWKSSKNHWIRWSGTEDERYSGSHRHMIKGGGSLTAFLLLKLRPAMFQHIFRQMWYQSLTDRYFSSRAFSIPGCVLQSMSVYQYQGWEEMPRLRRWKRCRNTQSWSGTVSWIEAFSKFGSDLDASTLAILNKGAKNVEILKQVSLLRYLLKNRLQLYIAVQWVF